VKYKEVNRKKGVCKKVKNRECHQKAVASGKQQAQAADALEQLRSNVM